ENSSCSWPANPPNNPGESEGCFTNCTDRIPIAEAEGRTVFTRSRRRTAKHPQGAGRSAKRDSGSSTPINKKSTPNRVPEKSPPPSSALPVPPGQLVQHLIQRKLRLPQKHQKMKNQIGRFVAEFLRRAVFGGDDHLRRLLPHLFQDFIQSLFKEIGGIGALRPLCFPGSDQRFQPTQDGETVMAVGIPGPGIPLIEAADR